MELIGRKTQVVVKLEHREVLKNIVAQELKKKPEKLKLSTDEQVFYNDYGHLGVRISVRAVFEEDGEVGYVNITDKLKKNIDLLIVFDRDLSTRIINFVKRDLAGRW